jgi:hypothetical protein
MNVTLFIWDLVDEVDEEVGGFDDPGGGVDARDETVNILEQIISRAIRFSIS